MKKIIFLILFVFFSISGFSQIVNRNSDNNWKGQATFGSGSDNFLSTHPGAWLQIGENNTNKGFLLPRVLDTSSVSSPANGLVVFSNADNTIYYYDVYRWLPLNTLNLAVDTTMRYAIKGDTVYLGVDTSSLNGLTTRNYVNNRYTGTGTISVNNSTGVISYTGGAGSGTVTSVGLSLPNIFTVSGSPVTTSGTLGGALASQNQNLFFASPNGVAGLPAFRSIVPADIPILNQNTTGSSGSVINALTPGYGLIGNAFNGSTGYTWLSDTSSSNSLTTKNYVNNRYSGSGSISINNSTGVISYTGGSGTVTSVALSLPNIFTVSGSPITGSGTLTAAFANQNQALVFASPGGFTGAPSFRALFDSDLPASGVIAGTYNNVTVTNEGIVTGGSNVSYAPSTGGTGYIQNQFTAAQAGANYWIDGNGRLQGSVGMGGDSINVWNKTYDIGSLGTAGFLRVNSGTSLTNASSTSFQGDLMNSLGGIEFDNTYSIHLQTIGAKGTIAFGNSGFLNLNSSGTSTWIYTDQSSALTGLMGVVRVFNNANYGVVSSLTALPAYTFTLGAYTAFNGHIDTLSQLFLPASVPGANVESYVNNNYGILQLTNYPNSFNGGIQMPIKTVSSSYALTRADYTVINTSGTNTFTLPAPNTPGWLGQVYHLICNAGTITTNVPFENLSGAGTSTISAGTAVEIQNDGTAWRQIGN